MKSKVHAMEAAAGSYVAPGLLITLMEWQAGVLLRRGRLAEVLGPGAHRRWRRGLELYRVDLRPWVFTVPTQEIPTADGPTVKITVAGQARVADPVAFVTRTHDAQELLYLSVQVALRDLVASTTVDGLLTGRGDLGERLLGSVAGLEGAGIAVERIELKDVVLPKDIQRAQAELLLARAQASAALERARGETAALRNLANAARMAADNPALVQLRLLQQLDASSGHTVVIGTSPVTPVRSPQPLDTGAARAAGAGPAEEE